VNLGITTLDSKLISTVKNSMVSILREFLITQSYEKYNLSLPFPN